MARTDYHTHTPLCLHAEGEPEEFVRQALALGLSEYGIADHMPMPPETEPYDEWRMRFCQLPEYLAWIEGARNAAAGSSLRVLCGMECDWLPGIEPWIRQLRDLYAWDYLIGSVHYIAPRLAVDDAAYEQHPIHKTAWEDWCAYAHCVLDMVQSGLFDIVGHMDLVKIWARRLEGEEFLFREVLDAVQGNGMVVELNTAGLHKKCGEQYPSRPLLRELLRRRIPIAINSDAHAPGQLSRDWEQAVMLLRELSPTALIEFSHPAPTTNTPLHVYGPL